MTRSGTLTLMNQGESIPNDTVRYTHPDEPRWVYSQWHDLMHSPWWTKVSLSPMTRSGTLTLMNQGKSIPNDTVRYTHPDEPRWVYPQWHGPVHSPWWTKVSLFPMTRSGTLTLMNQGESIPNDTVRYTHPDEPRWVYPQWHGLTHSPWWTKVSLSPNTRSDALTLMNQGESIPNDTVWCTQPDEPRWVYPQWHGLMHSPWWTKVSLSPMTRSDTLTLMNQGKSIPKYTVWCTHPDEPRWVYPQWHDLMHSPWWTKGKSIPNDTVWYTHPDELRWFHSQWHCPILSDEPRWVHA